MKIVHYRHGAGAPRFGLLEGGRITPVAASDYLRLFQPGGLDPAGKPVDANAVTRLAPVAPRKIVAVGLNYWDHCRESGAEKPSHPVLFAKFPTTISGPDDPVSWPRGLTEKVDFEAELGVVIGRTARGVTEANALDHVFGYICVNDLSARDLQFADGQWVRGKSLDGFCPVGAELVGRDEVPDPQALPIRCLVNGSVWQDSSTAEMIFPVASLIAFIAAGITLEPGDLILTGTPHGVGVYRDPPVLLGPGDVATVEIGGVGTLTTTIGPHPQG